jgi:4-diphosphocytidyl-2-C-methyl-D-erythritol kinase
VKRIPAAAKINLALVVGPIREDGLHEVVTVMQRVDLCDVVELEPAGGLAVEGFKEDTLVRTALATLATAAGVEPRWRARIRKRIPLAAGLGGGSADAAAALTLANPLLEHPLDRGRLHDVAAGIGADVPFFLEHGPKLAEGGGERLTALELPQDFWVVLALPRRGRKTSTADVYARFDETRAAGGFESRRAALADALAAVRRPRDFAAFPPNDLAEAAGRPPIVDELLQHGAFRADVSGAGPAVYGLFHHQADAKGAARHLRLSARAWVVAPVW